MSLNIGKVVGLIELQDKFSGQLAAAATGLDRFAKQADTLSQKLQNAGSKLTIGVTAPLVAIGAAALATGTSFIQTMNRVAAVTDASEADFKRLQSAAEEWGAKTQFSSTEAAQAMLELGKAGFTTDQTIGALPSTLALAAAANMSLADAANLTSNVMKTFQLQVSDLAHVNDVLAGAANLSTIEVTDLREAFKYVGPVAAQVGMSVAEASAAMALLGEAGIKGSMAGTTLRNTMTTLMTPTDKQAGLMKQLGLQGVYANGTMADLNVIIEKIAASGQDTSLVLELFGDRAGPGMAALVQKGSGALADLTVKLDQTHGSAQKMADAAMQGLPGALERMKGALETASTAILSGLEKPFTMAANAVAAVADFITNTAVPAFKRLPEPIQFATVALLGIGAAAGPVLLFLGGILGMAGSVAGLFTTMTRAMWGYAAATTAASAANKSFDATSLVAGMSSVGRQSLASTKMIEGMSAAGQKATPWLTRLFTAFSSGGAAATILSRALSVLTGPVGWIIGIGSTLLTLTGTWDEFFRILKAGAQIITSVVVGAFNRFLEVGGAVLNLLGRMLGLEGLGEKLGSWISTAGNKLRDFMGWAADKAEDLAAALKGTATESETLGKLQAIAATEMQGWTQAADQANKKASELKANLPATTKQIDELTRSVIELGTAGHLTPAVMAEVARQAKALADEGGTLSPALQNIVDAMNRTKPAADAAAGGIAKVGAATEKATSFLKEHQKKLNELTASIRLATVHHVDLKTQVELWGDEAVEASKKAKAFGQTVTAEVKKIADAALWQDATDRMNELAAAGRDTEKVFKDLGETGVHADGLITDSLGKALLKMQELTRAAKDFQLLTREESLAAFFKMGPIEPPKMDDLKKTVQSVFTDAFKGLPDLLIQSFTGGGNIKGALSGLATTITRDLFGGEGPLASVTKSLTGLVTKATGFLGPALSGVIGGIAGSVLPAIGALVMPAIEKIVGLFHKPEWKKVMKDVGRDWGVDLSEGLAKKIAETTKEMGRQFGTLLHLDEIVKEAGGVEAFGLDKLTARVHDVFVGLSQGALDAKQATDVLAKNFPMLSAAVVDTGKIASREFLEIIQLTQQFGLEVQQVTEFLSAQGARFATATTTAMQPLIAKFGELKDAADPAMFSNMVPEVERFGRLTLEAFNAAKLSGLTTGEAMAAVGPAIDQLIPMYERLKELGIATNNEALTELLRKRELYTANADLIASAGALNEMALSLSYLNGLNVRTLADLGAQASSTYDQMIAKGFTEGEALQEIRGMLETVRDRYAELGIPIDENTQKLLKAAEAQGVLKDKGVDTNTILIDGIGALIKAVGGDLPESFRKFAEAAKARAGEVADAVNRIPTSVGITARVDYEIPDLPRERFDPNDPRFMANGGRVLPFTPRIAHFADGGAVRDAVHMAEGMLVRFTPKGRDTVPAMLDPSEIVLNVAQQRNVASAITASSDGLQAFSEMRATGTEGKTVHNYYDQRSVDVSAVDAASLREFVSRNGGIHDMLLEDVTFNSKGRADEWEGRLAARRRKTSTSESTR